MKLREIQGVKTGDIMTDYNKMLIDLLNEKILRLNIENETKRKEINRLKKRVKELEKQNEKVS